MKRKIKQIEWLRYRGKDGKRFWWHPDDAPPGGEASLEHDGDVEATTMLRVRLDPPVDLSGCRFDALQVIWSEHQGCDFLVAEGIDSEGRTEEMRISVNLLAKYPAAHGYFHCRDEDYKSPIIAELIKREILKPTGEEAPSGFIKIPLFRFTPIEEAHQR